jgi:hypothetical protein
MPLQASGRIKLSEIATQFGGSGSHKLSEYYRGGANVEDTNINGNIPASGTNKLTDYYSTGNPKLTKIGSQEDDGAMDSGKAFTLDTAELSANTNIVVIASAGGSASRSGTMNITCANTSTSADIPYSYSRIKSTNYSSDGAFNTIGAFRVGDISSVTCARSGGNQSINKYFVLQYDNVPSFISASDTYDRKADDGTPNGACTLDMNNSFACVAFQSSFGGNMAPLAISNVDEHSDVTGNQRATVGYDAYRASGTVNYNCANINTSIGDRAPRLVTGVSFDLGYN